MAKILLVEDDNNLRDIYGERLMAEGYDILSASDGEEALQIAAQQKPDLIISDVMMPKISGFDMLDILRQTPDTKDIKIIMMTALSQAEDKSRADKLGANKYLVKSQVTLEDVARVVHDILGDAEPEPVSEQAPTQEPTSTSPIPTPELSVTTAPAETVTPTPEPQAVQPFEPAPSVEPVVQPQPEPQAVPEPMPQFTPPAPEPVAPVNTPAPDPVNSPINPIANPDPAVQPAPPAPEPVAPMPDPSTASPAPEPVTPQPAPQQDQPVVNPIAGTQSNPIEQSAAVSSSEAETTTSEMDEVAKQIETFVDNDSQVSEHQEPVKEPTEQEILHAQNANEDPRIVAANTAPANSQAQQPPTAEEPAPVAPTPNPTVPPITPQMDTANPEPTANRKKIIQPINDTTAPDIHKLYEQEMAEQAASTGIATPAPAPQPAETPQNEPVEEEVINPIVGQEAPVEASPPPLETFDVTQVSGVSTNPDEEFPSANPAQPTSVTPPVEQAPAPQVTEAPASATDIAEEEPADPNDPKNIAL